MDFYTKNSGFTLIELIIVLIVMGILTGIAYTRWPGTSINVAAQTSELADDIRYTQSLSMAKAQRFRLSLKQPNATSYQITDSSGNAIYLPTEQSGPGSTSITLGAGISFGAFTNLPNNMIVFDTKGTPYTDTIGTTLNAVASITLTSGSTTKTVSIQPETGRVTVQ